MSVDATDERIITTEDVYEPAEDSYLMIDSAFEAIEQQNRISRVYRIDRILHILEIGTGSGIVSSVLMRRAPEHEYIATDISPHAVACAKRNGLQVIRADLFAGLSGRFDLIVFNSPYLPTAPDERIDGWLDYAWNGGADGRATINRFLEQAPHFLAERGSVLLLVSSLTNIEKVCERMKSVGFYVHEAASVRCPGERLVVLRGSLRS